MPNDFICDGTTTADLRELRELSRVCAFDLFEFMRLLEEAGVVTFTYKVDDKATVDAGRTVLRYQLSDPLLIVLAALRVRAAEAITVDVESGAGHP